MLRRVWEDVPVDAAEVRAVAAAVGVPEVIARLLCQRGFDNPDVARRFLSPELSHLHDPFLLTGMEQAVDRLLQAIQKQECIGIHGDYDVDGMTATVILRRAIELVSGNV